MTTTLKESLRPVDEWMGRVLRNGVPLAAEYPLVFHEGFSGQVVTLGVEGAIQSACTILVRDFVAAESTFRVGLIGSVTTDPDHRHQGLATRLLLEAERILREKGAFLSLLWADSPKFYFTRGYKPVGCEVDFAIPPDAAERLPESNDLRAATPADFAAIHALYEQHPSRVVRSEEESAALLACPNMDTRVLERDGTAVAYACMGRGADFERTIHEWGGSPDDVLAIVRRFSEEAANDSVFLMSSSASGDLHERMRELGFASTPGLLGLGKLLDRRRAAEVFDAWTPAQLRVAIEEAGGATPRVTARGPSGSRELDDESLLDLLFPSRDSRAEQIVTAQACGVDLRTLPIPIFAWGLDSI